MPAEPAQSRALFILCRTHFVDLRNTINILPRYVQSVRIAANSLPWSRLHGSRMEWSPGHTQEKHVHPGRTYTYTTHP